MAVAMGGRIAEELIFGVSKVTTGASSDISMATNIARKMVTEWGMSEKLGPLAYGENEQEVFLGHSVTQKKNVSENTAQEIDKEIKKIVDQSYKKAQSIIKKNMNQLHRLAKGLLKYETLTGEEIKDVIKGKKINKFIEKNKNSRKKTLSPVPSVGKNKKNPDISEPQLENN